MNTRKLRKVLLTLCSALLLVSLSVGVTIAYLTDSESVKNTFSVGNVGLKLDEADVWESTDENVDPEKLGTVKEGADRVQKNDYKLYPNGEYTKDPTITIDATSEDCWVVAKVVVTAEDINKVRTLLSYDETDLIGISEVVKGGVFDHTYTYADGKWTSDAYVLTQTTDTVDGKDANVFYVYVQQAKSKNDTIKLFEKITVPSGWGNNELANLEGLNMDITAYAIQKDGFDTVEEAFTTAFPGV